MIRTKVVELSVIPGIAFRQKFAHGGAGITLMRYDYKQPGLATISTHTGEPVLSENTNIKKYPPEAFKEAMELTFGLPYKKLNSVKITDEKVKEVQEKTKEELAIEEEYVVIDSADYQKLLDKYTDKNGKFSYDLMNKDFIRFAKSSSIVRDMVAEGESAAKIRNYVVTNKIRNITGDDDLSDKQINQITDMLAEGTNKGVFKELDAEIRKMLGAGKGKNSKKK